MRDYGTVSPRFWRAGTGKRLRGDAHAQLLALYLMTSPHSNMIGVYFCTVRSMSDETGIPFEGASKALRRLVDEGFCQFDEETDEVFVVQMAAHQIAERLEPKDNRCKSVARELALVDSPKLQAAFLEVYREAFNVVTPPDRPVDKSPSGEGLRRGFEAPSKPRAGAGAGTGTRAGGGAPPDAGCAGPPAALPKDFREFIAVERPDLDPGVVHANFCDHYPEAKRTLKLWKNWVRREHQGTGQPPTRGQAQPITVPGRAGRDPILAQIEADRQKAVPPSGEVRARLDALRKGKAEVPA
ncbi:MAG: hypothetical protein RL375_787 [Pseudomonadota bacterium]|jgi:hypothetical protein